MATELQVDNFALLPPPREMDDQEQLEKYLKHIHDYMTALTTDLRNLRDVVDGHHP